MLMTLKTVKACFEVLSKTPNDKVPASDHQTSSYTRL